MNRQLTAAAAPTGLQVDPSPPPSGLPSLDPGLANRRHKKQNTHCDPAEHLEEGPTSSSGTFWNCTPPLVSLGAVDYCCGRTGATESPPAVEEEHSPSVGCMLRRATQAPTAEDNCHREGERGGVGKEELEKRMIICYVNTGSGLHFNWCVGALVSDRLHVR